MTKLEQAGFVERLNFFNGQRLVADDLQGLEGLHRELRELHNRSLHQPGIGNGFAVSGERGDRELTIGAGYAIDIDGHEIILVETRKERVPPVEGEDDGGPVFYYLTVSYPGDEHLEETETRAGVCHPRGTVRFREEPVFCWVRLVRDESGRLLARDLGLRNQIHAGQKIILAQVEVKHCALQKLTIAQRRNAKPSTQPYIACGRVRPVWALQPSQSSLRLITAEIDTSEAEFLATPCYSARVHGDRVLMFTLPSVEGGSITVEIFAEALVTISHEPAPTAEAFTVSVLVVPLAGNLDGLFRVLDDDNVNTIFDWEVEWMGVE